MTRKLKLTPTIKADLERFASEDGVQRGIFFDTSGNMRVERVSATAQHLWLFKTKAGNPFEWGKDEP